MVFDRNKGIRRLVILGECSLATLAFWIWIGLWWRFPESLSPVARYLIYNELMLLGLISVSWPSAKSAGIRTPTREETNHFTVRQLGGALFYLLLSIIAAQDGSLCRFLLSFIPLLYLILFASNRFLPGCLGRLTFPQRSQEKVVLVGPKRKASEVKHWLDRYQHLGLHTLGLLTDDPPEIADKTLPVLGRPRDLERVLNAPGRLNVIVADYPQGSGSMKHYADLCDARGIRLLVAADVDEIFGYPYAAIGNHGIFLLGPRREPLEDPINRFMKRCLDVALSSFVLCLVLPFCGVIVWCLQRAQSPGPLIYGQKRPGFHNKPFTIYKFRSLHLSNPDENQLPTAMDPRVYPAGRWLRKRSVDELPQFINVLRGDMSVVGPRPHLMADNDRFPSICNRAYVRSFVKPGITGLAQVRGYRGKAETSRDINLRLECDIEYLENWSFLLDCRLILRTALQMVFPLNAAV